MYNIKVMRVFQSTTEPWGCVIADDQGYPIVSKGSDGDKCSRFELTNESSTSDPQSAPKQYRFKEMYVHKARCSLICSHSLSLRRTTRQLMRHGGDWIYLNGALDDTSDATLFIMQKDDLFSYSILRPADASNQVYADYDSGALNVKNKGFQLYFRLKEYCYSTGGACTD